MRSQPTSPAARIPLPAAHGSGTLRVFGLATAVALLMGSLGVAAGCSAAGASDGTEVSAVAQRNVEVAAVERGTVRERLVYATSLAAQAQAAVTSPVADRIVKMDWSDGDFVSKGETVAVVRSTRLRQSLAQLNAEIEALDVQIRFQRQQLERTRKLHRERVVTEQALDQAAASHQGSLARRKALVASRAQVRQSVKDTTIVAPLSGVIANKRARVGELTSPGVPLATLLDVEQLVATLDVAEQDLRRVRLGQRVVVELQAYPAQPVAGEVTRILPYLDPATRTNRVEVTLANPADPGTGQRRLKPAMFGRATLVLVEREGAALVPERAVMRSPEAQRGGPDDAPAARVFVVGSDGGAHARGVRLGLRDGARREVLSGLAPGERVVVRGQHGLKSGDPVAVVAGPPAAPERLAVGPLPAEGPGVAPHHQAEEVVR